jgi:hypothetical protein
MADKKPAKFEFVYSILTFTALIAVCIWVGTIMASAGEARLQRACMPVQVTTQALHDVTAALSGTQPSWTLYSQRYLMTGCYYFFNVLLRQPIGLQGEEPAPGGIRTH